MTTRDTVNDAKKLV